MAAPVLACGQDPKMSKESAKLEQQGQEQTLAKATDQGEGTQLVKDQLEEEKDR